MSSPTSSEFPADRIVVAQWVRLKCAFGCGSYGQKAASPANVPSVAECREFFGEYRDAVAFHFEGAFDNLNIRLAWGRAVNRKLLALKRYALLMVE